MSDIDWNFVLNNVFISFIVLFCVLTAGLVVLTIYYMIRLNRDLKKVRYHLLAKERAVLIEKRKLSKRGQAKKHPDISAHVDPTALMPLSEQRADASKQSTASANGSQQIADNNEIVANYSTSVDTKTEPTII